MTQNNMLQSVTVLTLLLQGQHARFEYLVEELIVALWVQTLVVEVCAIRGAQVHNVWPHLAHCQPVYLFICQPAITRYI